MGKEGVTNLVSQKPQLAPRELMQLLGFLSNLLLDWFRVCAEAAGEGSSLHPAEDLGESNRIIVGEMHDLCDRLLVVAGKGVVEVR